MSSTMTLITFISTTAKTAKNTISIFRVCPGTPYTINITPKFELGITADSASEEYAQSFPKMTSYYTDKNYEIGDVNLDGVINIMDVTYLQMYIASAHDLNKTAKKLSDVNGSGDINIMDATQIQIIIAR